MSEYDEKLPSLAQVVSHFRQTPFEQRRGLLNRYIGPITQSPAELQRRALLVTALREANLFAFTDRPIL